MEKRTNLKWIISPTISGLISLFLLASACSNSEESTSFGIYPIKKERVSLDIDDETKSFTRNIRFLETENGEEWLLHLNEINNTIGIYDLKSGKKVRTAYYESEGPNGVGNIDGFDIISLDSILLLSRYENRLSLTSLNTSDTLQIYESYQLKYTNASTEATTYSSVNAPIAIINGKAHLAAVPFVGNSTPHYKAGNNLLQLDLNEYTFEYQNLYTRSYSKTWPDLYTYISYDFNEQEKLLVFSLPIEDSIFTIDQHGQRTSYLANSKNLKQTKPFRRDLTNQDKTREHYIFNDSYGYILYDKYRNYYYRFTETVARDVIKEYGTDFYIRQFGVIVMNENFEIIGELDSLFSGFLPPIFVGKQGIYNMLGSNDESKMNFDLYAFE